MSESDSADEGSAVITDLELRALLARARATGDVPLRQLVSEFVTLRRVTADVIAFIEAREGGAAVANVPLLLRAKQLAKAPVAAPLP